MSKPRLLDLFAGAGGAAMGYHQAGFDVVGIDNRPQPRYPFRFIQGDALSPPVRLEDFDVIHASPPCQAYTVARVIHGHEHPDMMADTRALLVASGRPWIIENVPQAPMRPDFVLCGSQFGEPRLRRHRWFEVNWESAHLISPCAHAAEIVSVFGHGGHVYHGVEDWRRVMGIDWMARDELAQAIPPAFTRFIGEQLLEHLAVNA